MADRLADELLQMILSPSLTILDQRFSSPSSEAFGSNDLVSSASVLLVCKKWLRVATPLLYEVVVLRSTPQAQALSDSFKQNPAFALHVKRMRLEGTYSCLWDIFKRCTNLHTLSFTLDIYSSSTVTGLCRSLATINPTRVILRDSCETINANVKKVFSTLCESIPKWTHLCEFELPPGYLWARGRQNFKAPQLFGVLSGSSTLETIVSMTPYDWDEKWSKLAENPRINFKFDRERQPKTSFPSLRSRRTELMSRIKYVNEWINRWTSLAYSHNIIFAQSRNTRPSTPDISSSSTSGDQTFTPLPIVVPDMASTIWRRIIAFAVLPGHPDSLDDEDFVGKHRPWFCVLNSTRRSLLLVSKSFRDLTQPFLFQVPILTSESSLMHFTSLARENQSIAQQVRRLSITLLWKRGTTVDASLSELVPRLTSLEQFVGAYLPISPRVFRLLAEAAGTSLVTISNLGVDKLGDQLDPTVFTLFTKVFRVHFRALPGLLPGGNTFPNRLEADKHVSLAFPRLTSARIPFETNSTRVFLELCGSRLLHLEFSSICFPDSDAFDALHLCPNLKVFRWDCGWRIPNKMFLESCGNTSLERIDILAEANPRVKANSLNISTFLGLDTSRFPALRKIHFKSYNWPTEEREISKDVIVAKALEFKKDRDVDILDASGKTWRKRAERRR